MRQRLEKALRTIAALPEDGWEPYTWDEFLSARAVVVNELGRMDRAASAGSAAKRRTQARTSIPESSRSAVRARSRGLCEVTHPGCTGKATHMHHRLMRSQGGGNDPVNLLHVCTTGHAYIHGQPAWAYERGFLLHAFGEETG